VATVPSHLVQLNLVDRSAPSLNWRSTSHLRVR
jgi:hypothetical protein